MLRKCICMAAVLFCFCGFSVQNSACAAERNNTLIIGVPPHAAPLSYLSENRDGAVGLAVDLSVQMAKELGREILFVQSNSRNLERKLRRGEIDAIVGLLPANLKTDFSDTLITPLALNRTILVARPDAQFAQETELAGRKVLVVRGDDYAAHLEDMGCIVLFASSMNNALNRLLAGEAEAYVVSSAEMAWSLIQRRGDKGIRAMGGSIQRVPMVMMVRRDESHLFERLTSALVRLEESGQVNTLREKWLGRSLEVPSIWELYRTRILTGVALAVAAGLLFVVWIHMLRRQVKRITRRFYLSESRYRRFIEQAPDIIVLFDEQGKIQFANHAAEESLRLTKGEADRALVQALCSETKGCLASFIALIPENGALCREITLYRGTDQERVLEIKLFFSDTDGSCQVCLIGRDMTERCAMDKQLLEMERLAMIGKTSAGVAHEINNPVGIIMANTELALEDCPEGSPLHPLLKAIYRNGERAVATTRRLLNIALPASMQMERQNLAQLAREALIFLRPRLKGVRVDSSRIPQALSVRGDKIRLEQLVINIIINALDSMEGRDDVRALVIEGQCADGRVFLDISDTGTGISKKSMEKLFDPFFSTKGHNGFGLGLYIAQHIMKLHGGEIICQSEEGAGTTMSLCFPMFREGESAAR